MSWFGGNLPQLSSITDQISSFTKEVLTETTEEVEGILSEIIFLHLRPSKPIHTGCVAIILNLTARKVLIVRLSVADPIAELQIARRKIHELESLNKHIESEVHMPTLCTYTCINMCMHVVN